MKFKKTDQCSSERKLELGNNPQHSLYLSRMKKVGVGLGTVALLLGIGSPLAIAYQLFSNLNLTDIPLSNEPVDGQSWEGEDINFQQLEDGQFDVSFDLAEDAEEVQLTLKEIDLSLLIPQVPAIVGDNEELAQWFLTEREFNRQRVIFEPNSPHIELSGELAGYDSEDISISLTNNCLGAGHWELAVFSKPANGESEKLYQGYFQFPLEDYAEMVSQLNPVFYQEVASKMEAWPGFSFLQGMYFPIDELRQVRSETAIAVSDLKTEPILAVDEQADKAKLIVYADDFDADGMRTWQDLREADLKFQSFIAPGIYDDEHLWNSDFEQLHNVTGATGRRISAPTSDKELTEVQIEFEGKAGEVRQLIISGIDLDEVPQLDSSEYSSGVYSPLGFGTPFTQEYSKLVQNPPAEYSFFSAVLDQDGQVVNYRGDIGINGLVLHRDVEDASKLHLYIMSYERITLVGHYVLDLGPV